MTYLDVLSLALSLDNVGKARLLYELSNAVMNDTERTQGQLDHIKSCNRIAMKLTKNRSVRAALEE